MLCSTDDTIAAIATAAGGAARGMVRVSGPDAAKIAAACFSANDDRPLDAVRQPTALPGRVRITLAGDAPRSVPCDLFLWPTSRSYTRQPVAELHTIGAPPLVDAVLAAVCRAGARLAEPGEFTLRALLAGRLDLTQAEAVLGVIDAQHVEDLDAALAQLAGGLAQPLGTLRDELVSLLADLEAGLDFADEDIEFISADALQARLKSATALLTDVSAQMTSRLGPRPAAQVVLTGPPNVGKSSLFNKLVVRYGTDSAASRATTLEAIVSPYPGATRDYLTAEIRLNGLRCELVDTAGIDPHERISDHLPLPLGEGRGEGASIDAAAQSLAAERRAHAAVRVLCVEAPHEDASPPLPLGEGWGEGALLPLSLEEGRGERSTTAVATAPCDLIAITKADLGKAATPLNLPADSPDGVPVVVTSSHTGQGLDELRAVLTELLSADATATRSQVVAATADRCRESVRLAADAIQRAADVLATGGGDELVAVELRDALDHLGQVVGAVYTDDLLDRIFSKFCIGK